MKGEEHKFSAIDTGDTTTKFSIKKKTHVGGSGDQITMRIRELSNGVTKLISGRPDFVANDFTLIAKAIF